MKLYVGLGANLGDRQGQLEKAIRALESRIGPCTARSPFHETEPAGFASPHLFLNAVAVYETGLPPARLLAETQAVERELGRTEKSRDGVYQDRTVDIDLLLLGDTVVREEGLTLPHPEMERRRFVLEPLCEVEPDVRHPLNGLTASQMLERLNRAGIRRVESVSPETLEALNRLLPQLSSHAAPLTAEDLSGILACEATRLFTATDEEGRIQGTATLCLYRQLTGPKAWIEDVVVDRSCRGRGYGRQLVRHLTAEAERLGACSVNLTSQPSRVAANALYAACGFARRHTNVYRFDLPDGTPGEDKP